ncbi:hypothetical protein ABIE51_001574 [Lysobacter sp. OAE881]
MDSSFRWNDDGCCSPLRGAPTLRAWVPAIAGMTVMWVVAPEEPGVASLRVGRRRD